MKEKKKLLFVIPTLRIGGAEKALVSLLKAMDPERYAVDLFLFEQGGELQPELPVWVRLLPENIITRGMLLEFRYYFKDLLRQRAFAAATARAEISLQAAIRGRLGKKPLFSWKRIRRFVEPLPEKYDTAIAFLEDFTSDFVIDKVTARRKLVWVHTDLSVAGLVPEQEAYFAAYQQIATISPVCKASLETVVPAARGRISVIENIVLPEDVQEKAQAPLDRDWDPDRIHLVTLGRLEEVKGIDMAVWACKLLRDEGLPVLWHVFGEGSKKESLDQLIAKLGLQDSFRLEGTVSNPLPYVAAAAIFVQPSRKEGKSIALEEARILGKPIVVTNYPSVEDQIQHRVTGIVTQMEPKSIAEGIAELLREPALCRQISANCLSTGSSYQEVLEKIYRLIDGD